MNRIRSMFSNRKIRVAIVLTLAVIVVCCGLVLYLFSFFGDQFVYGEEGFNEHKYQYGEIVKTISNNDIKGEYVLPSSQKQFSNKGKVLVLRTDSDLTIYFVGNTDWIDPGEIVDCIVYSASDKEPDTANVRMGGLFLTAGNIKRLEKNWYVITN